MRQLRSLFMALVLCAVWQWGAAPLLAQSDNGTITGYVRDPSGSVVPDANVTVKNEATNNERKVTTNSSGYYTVTNIPPGSYTVTADVTGFKKFQATNNKLDPSSTLSVDVNLAVGSATETVEVTATAPTLQSQSAAVQKLVTRQQIDSLELNGRNPIGMAQLVPGARGGNLANLNINFSQGPSQLNGARTQETIITYDGAPAVRTRSNGTSLGAADVDSTQEIQVMTANYDAEYGRSSGGQIRIISKSGTQQFHGAAYEYVRNTALNANTWQRNLSTATNSTAPIHYNQYGYNVSGPFFIPNHLNRDRTKFFWYWGQEWVKYHYTDQATLEVPSAAMRNGDFSELLNPSNFYYGKAVVIRDPTTKVAYPNNVIPASVLSPNGLGLLRAYPDANLATPINGNQNWIKYALHTVDQRKDTLNADINLTDNQRLSFRRLNFQYNEYQPLDGGSDRTPKYFIRPNQTNSLSHTWTISPTVVNEARATVSLDDVYIPVDTANFYDRTNAGIDYPYIFPVGKTVPTRIPTIQFSGGLSQLSGGPYPSHSSGPIYTATDSLTWVKGTHTFKFGVYYERSGENDNDEINVNAVPGGTNNQNGQFSFSDGRSGNPTSGNAIANAALGLFDSYSEIGQRAYTIFRGQMTEAFAQDSWQVTPKFHLDYGLRYSVIVPYSALWRNMIVFDPSYYDPSKAVTVDPKTGFVIPGSGDAYNGMVIPGSGFPDSAKGRVPQADSGQYNYLFRGAPSYYSNIQWNNWQPRVGMAYQVDDKTVLRAGAGRFISRTGVSDSIFLGGNPPFQPQVNVSFGSVDNPGGSSVNNYPLTVTTQSKNFANPEAWNWNFTIERQIFWNSVFTAAYVGRRGLHEQREANINQPLPGVVAANPGVNINALRPYKGFGSLRESDNIANSRYNALQLSWNRRLTKGLLFGVAYTLSASNDDGSNQRDVIPNTYDAHNLWGPSEFDSRHVLVFNYLYELPIFRSQKGFAGKVLGGWQISGLTQFQSGTPCGVGQKNDFVGVGQDGSFGCGNAGQFYNVAGNPQILGQFAANGSKDPSQWFSTRNPDGSPIFVPPAPGTFSNQYVRNLIYQPGFQNWNLGLFKAFAINDTTGFQFRAEAFNFVNHPNIGGSSGGGVNFDPTSSSFGKVTTKGSERNIMLSLRFYF